MKPDIRSEVSLALASDIRAVHRALRLRVRDHGGSKGLTASQLSVLVRLEADGPTTVSSLARAESMRPQSMRDIVAPLQKKGLVSSSPDPQDRRQILMALTPECTEWIKAGKSASHDWLTDAISRHLTATEQRQLGEALILLRRVVQT